MNARAKRPNTLALHRIMWIRVGLALAIAAIVPTLYHWHPKKRRSNALPPSQERVVILGASTLDGIGAAIARQCVARGCSNILLVARREEALNLVKNTIVAEQTMPAARACAEAIELCVADCSNVSDVYRLQTRIAEGMSIASHFRIWWDRYNLSRIRCLVDSVPAGRCWYRSHRRSPHDRSDSGRFADTL